MIFTFNYTDCPIEPSPAFPEGHVAKRPVLEVCFPHSEIRPRCIALVDSGADYTLFPKHWAEEIGLSLDDALLANTVAIGCLPATVFREVEIEIEALKFRERIYAGFTDSLEDLGVGLLGQNGFFDRVKRVSFMRALNIFEVET